MDDSFIHSVRLLCEIEKDIRDSFQINQKKDGNKATIRLYNLNVLPIVLYYRLLLHVGLIHKSQSK